MPVFEFKCKYCDYKCNRRSNLERHLNRYHIDDYYDDLNTCQDESFAKFLTDVNDESSGDESSTKRNRKTIAIRA